MLELRPCADLNDWDRRIAGHPRATVFHRADWLSFVARLVRAELHPFLLHRGDEVVGGVPLFAFRRGPFRIAASPPPQAATPYLGPVVEDALLGEALAAISVTARQLKASYVELRLDREISADVLRASLFEQETRATFVLDLRPGLEALWTKSLNSSCRRAIRKAEGADVVIQEVDLEDIVDRYAELAAEVFAKSNRPPPLVRADYVELANVARRCGCVKVFAARREGKLIAAGIFPFGNGSIYYLDGVSDQAEQQARPNNLLHWEVIRWVAGRGLERYDMVGAGIAGVARFKRSFGPLEVPYTYAFRNLTSLAAVARAAYAALAPAARGLQYAAGRLRGRG